MYIQKDLIVSPNGDVLLTIREDQTAVAQNTQLLKEETGGWNEDRTNKVAMRIPSHEYYHWIDTVGEGCWDDPDFQKFYKARRPEFCL